MANVFNRDWVSDYIFHDSLNWRPDNVRNKTLTKMQVIDAFDDGIITYSDLYILYAVNVMTYANLYQLMKYTKWWKTYNKEIPLNSADDEEAFKGRVETLVKTSLLKRFKFVNGDGQHRDCYYVTPNGYNFIKRKLYFKGSYDEFLGAAPVQEILKYLSNNELLLKIIENVSVEEGYHMESKPLYTSHIQFYDRTLRDTIVTYGFLNIRYADKKAKILIEPYRPTYDVNVFAKGQMEENQKMRFDFLERYIRDFNQKNAGTGSLKVVFTSENLKAAKELAKKIMRYDEYTRKNMYITIDKTIQEKGLDNTFFKVVQKEVGSKPVLTLASLEIE
ncbi:MAG: hypothetical protein JEZ08_16440 [Clostridiales bacterium]|nr:hypothetical protein [Clostridiales bacterium]